MLEWQAIVAGSSFFGRSLAVGQLGGALGKLYAHWRTVRCQIIFFVSLPGYSFTLMFLQEMIACLAHVEAVIVFAEDEAK